MRHLQAGRIAPQIFEAVVAPFRFVKDVDHDIAEISHHPMARREPVHGMRAHSMVLAEPILHLVGDRLEVRFAGAGADHEEVREAGNVPQVENDDVFGLFVSGNGRTELG